MDYFYDVFLNFLRDQIFGWMDFQWKDINLIKNPFVFQR